MEKYIQEIRKLIDELNYHTTLYEKGQEVISDREWDGMYFNLQNLENEYQIYYEDSPTQRVNYQIVNELNKVKHSHPMLSLDKTKDIKIVESFIQNRDYIAMAKMDGLTCSLTYENGRLTRAETRGNGIIGEDILHNALVVKNIPNKINYKNKLVIDGEIICTYEDFKSFSNEYKNPRNFASGSIRLLDNKECKKRKLSFVAWDVIEGLDEEKTLHSKLWALYERFSFSIVPYQCEKNRKVEEKIKRIQNDCNILGYPIDGIVFKYNNCDEYKAAGRTDHHFKGGIAYKFYDEEYETTLEDIEWTMGRTGQLTPVAVYDDIDIDGTICNRASLHNLTILKDTLGGYGWEGQEIKVFKANQIIPQISWSQPENEFTKLYFHYPMTCPICNAPTEIRKDVVSEVLYCSNPNCEGKLLNQLDHFCSKKGLDIKGLSKATLEKLIDWGWTNSKKDIFELKRYKEEWIKKPSFGEKSVNNILESIEKSKNTTLDKVIAAAGIPEIGISVSKDLAKNYKNWNDFRSEINYSRIEGIGEVMNENLLSFDYSEMDKIIEKYLIFEKNSVIINTENENKINNLTIVITGKLEKGTRDELKSKIETLGGKVTSSISSKTSLLINNDVTSQTIKNQKAKELGIPIITEKEFYEKYLNF